MGIERFEKEFIAVTQLERAIALFEEPKDYLSAITLAGAAEEILGKLVVESGRDSSVTSLARAAVEIHRLLTQENVAPRDIIDRANCARNALKHLNTSAGRAIDLDAEEEARDVIGRAIDNYWILKTTLTPAMTQFASSQRAV